MKSKTLNALNLFNLTPAFREYVALSIRDAYVQGSLNKSGKNNYVFGQAHLTPDTPHKGKAQDLYFSVLRFAAHSFVTQPHTQPSDEVFWKHITKKLLTRRDCVLFNIAFSQGQNDKCPKEGYAKRFKSIY